MARAEGMTETDTETNKHRSLCPLASALDLLGDKWTLLIVRDLIYFGPSTFKRLSQSSEGIQTNTLADRLKKLEKLGVISKQPYQERPVRHEYALTEKGLSLIPVVKSLTLWGQDNIEARETIVAVEDGVERMTRPVSVDLALLSGS